MSYNLTEKWLKDSYVKNKLSTVEMAALVGCSISTIQRNLKKHKIPLRSISEANKGKKLRLGAMHSIETKNRLREINKGKTLSQKTRKKIAQSLKGRRGKITHVKLQDSEYLEEFYVSQQKSCLAIAKIVGCSETNVRYWMKKHKIKRRTLKEASNKGRDNHMWKLPSERLTPLYKQIRSTSRYAAWRGEIYKRDDHTCQLCDQRGGKLNADHILPLCVLIRQNNISTLEQALACDEMWDTDNGRTLCVKCHKATDTYGVNFIFLRQGELT